MARRTYPTRAKWRSSSSARGCVLKKSLTLPTLLEMAILRQLNHMEQGDQGYGIPGPPPLCPGYFTSTVTRIHGWMQH